MNCKTSSTDAAPRRRALACSKGEHPGVGVSSLRRTVVAGQDHEVGSAYALGRFRGLHEGALIGGCASGQPALWHRNAKYPSANLFVTWRTGCEKHSRRQS